MTPATAGPVAIPPRTTIGSPDGHWSVPASARMSSDHPDGGVGVIGAWASARPATAMYASPIVLIFSRPCRSAISSKWLKSSSRASANASG